MLRSRVAAVAFFFSFSIIANAVPRYAFRVTFTDKGTGSSVARAAQFLSPRALERRSQQGIALDEKDLPVSSEYVQRIIEITNGSLHLTSKWLNSCVIWLKDSSKIQALKNEPNVASVTYVSKDEDKTLLHSVQQAGNKTTADPAHYGATWTQTNFVKGACLHDKGFRGKGKLIAVLDDGFHYVDTKPAFDSVYNSGRILDTRNFVQGGTDVYTSFLTHGTIVLSTMAGNIPNTYIGAAPDAFYALYTTEDPSGETPVEMDNMVAAMERADSIGADIISASIGYNTFDPPFTNLTPADMDGKTTVAAIGANIAARKGMLVVISAGNEGNWGLLTPGDADSALTVGNVDVNNFPAGSSGHGPNASNHIKPEVCALGQPGYVITAGLSPFASSGTSISTPQIAGWAACLWQAGTGKNNAQIKQAILQSSHLFPNPQMPQLGYGIPDFCVADMLLQIEDVKPSSELFSVYPNPFRDEIFVSIKTPATANVLISITDIAGRIVYLASQTIYTGNHNLHLRLPADLAKGIYLCKLSLQNEVKTFKIVKQ